MFLPSETEAYTVDSPLMYTIHFTEVRSDFVCVDILIAIVNC
jgi:hypothetical protein